MMRVNRWSRRDFGLLLVLLALLVIGAAPVPAAAAAADCFTLNYPTNARPAQITRKFQAPAPGKTPYEATDLAAPTGSSVRAGAAGKVTRVVTADDAGDGKGWGAYVTVKTNCDGVTYKVSYGSLQTIKVSVGQMVAAGEVLGKVSADTVKLIIQSKQVGLDGFKVPNIVNPKPFLILDALRLRPVANGLRVRAEPNTESAILGQVSQWDFIVTPLTPYKAMLVSGRSGRWLEVTYQGKVGYVAAEYVKVVSLNDPVEGIPGIAIKGMNLDRYQPLGTPPAATLQNLGWVRLNYNVSYNPDTGTYGNTDLAAAYNRFYPVLQAYAGSGRNVILVLTHQFYGEGQGYVWDQMSAGQWEALTTTYTTMLGQVAAQYAGSGLIAAYQIWNEPDTPIGVSQAAVPMPVNHYADLLNRSILAIRLHDPQTRIITGGYVTGTGSGVAYAHTVLDLLPDGTRPDGIAFHPYGVGPAGSPFSIFGTIDEAIKAWSGVMPDTPLWITEWGVLDHQGNDGVVGQVTDFATGFTGIIEEQFPGMVAAAVWYAWADGMDNGYGMVTAANIPREPLYSTFLGNVPAPLRGVLPGGVVPLPVVPLPTQ